MSNDFRTYDCVIPEDHYESPPSGTGDYHGNPGHAIAGLGLLFLIFLSGGVATGVFFLAVVALVVVIGLIPSYIENITKGE